MLLGRPAEEAEGEGGGDGPPPDQDRQREALREDRGAVVDHVAKGIVECRERQEPDDGLDGVGELARREEDAREDQHRQRDQVDEPVGGLAVLGARRAEQAGP